MLVASHYIETPLQLHTPLLTAVFPNLYHTHI